MTVRPAGAVRGGLLVALAVFLLASCGSDAPKPHSQAPLPASTIKRQPPSRLARRFFSPHAIWNTPLPANVPLDPRSQQLSAAVAAMARHYGSALSVYSYSVPLYMVGPHQPRVRVTLDLPNRLLQAAFDRVPLPADAQPATGTDAHLVVYQPATDTMWEFWKMHRLDGNWHASWGGRMVHVSQNPGYFKFVTGQHGQPLEESNWGATATGLPLVGGLILPSELRQGEIDHALSVALPLIRAGVRAAPAQRTDGRYSTPDSVPEGARFRLDPSLNLDALGLPWPTLIIARAVQRYGMIVRDGGRQIAMYAQDPVNLPSNPYPSLLHGLAPYQVLRDFPWNHLQLVRMELR